MPNVFPEIKAGDGEHQRVLARLEQIDEDLEHLVVGLIQLVGVFAPKLLRAVHRRPLESSRADLGHIFVIRTAFGGKRTLENLQNFPSHHS